MAEIVLGVGSSHSPLLQLTPEEWDLRTAADRVNPAHPFRGRNYTFDELVELRKDENLGEQNALEVRRERDARNQAHMASLGQTIREAELDVFIVIGDDQNEVFHADHNPAFLIHNGATVLHQAPSAERSAAMTEGQRLSNRAYLPEEDIEYEGAQDLANHIVATLTAEEFDVCVSDNMPKGEFGDNGVPHAFGFFYHRLLDDFRGAKTPKMLPIFINTFFPPNQPTAKRVLDFGKAMGRAIRAHDEDLRVGVAASGGFSHFVIDEELDWRLLKAIQERDADTLIAEPESSYQSGTSEIKNWIAAMGVTEGTGLEFELAEYIPCYRSEAGTGNAMAFGLWT
jgi:hypothetical protein